MLALAIDGLLLVLLLGVLGLGLHLRARLTALRAGDAELRSLVAGLDQAVRQAEKVVAELRRQAETGVDRLSREVQRAERMAVELKLLGDRADHRVERLMAARTTSAGADPEPSAARPAPGGATPAPDEITDQDHRRSPPPNAARAALMQTLDRLR